MSTALEAYEEIFAFVDDAYKGEVAWGRNEWRGLFSELIERADAALEELAQVPGSESKRRKIRKDRKKAVKMVRNWSGER